jgi:hypothetical protein
MEAYPERMEANREELETNQEKAEAIAEHYKGVLATSGSSVPTDRTKKWQIHLWAI